MSSYGRTCRSTDDRFVRLDLMFPVHFDSLTLGGNERACQISPFFSFVIFSRCFVGGQR